jgi:hypothetical protein
MEYRMNPQWQTYLQQQGATFENQLTHFGKLEEEWQQVKNGNLLTNLSHLGLIKVDGADAQKFLQGQLTNDVREVTSERSQFSAWCTPKGRVFINFRLLKHENAYFLILPRECVEATLTRLKMYILRAPVHLEDISEQWTIFGMMNTSPLTDCLNSTPPLVVNATVATATTIFLHHQNTPPRYLLITQTPQPLWQCLSQKIAPVSTTLWQLLEILAAIPQILPITSDEFVPQMINYQALGGISFKKGCYTGQEIVARMQYLGSLKRRMYLVKINTTALPQAGDSLFLDNEEQSVGKIVNAQKYPDGGVIALAVIQIDSVQSQKSIHWQSQQGDVLTIMELPYPI